MVSIWPTVGTKAENYPEILKRAPHPTRPQSQPKVRHAGLDRRHRVFVELVQQPTRGGPGHGPGGNSLVRQISKASMDETQTILHSGNHLLAGSNGEHSALWCDCMETARQTMKTGRLTAGLLTRSACMERRCTRYARSILASASSSGLYEGVNEGGA